nr:DUF2938 family protein [uncultured Flavobacterium sp.]
MNSKLRTILVGIGATVTVDLFTAILSFFTHKGHGILYIGRWVSYIFKGKIFHNNIMETPRISNELIIGWLSHYVIGILFAFVLVSVFRIKWLQYPNFLAAIKIGLLTLFFPVCILQPAMGFGIGFSKLPESGFLLTKIILIHLVYGFGLYFTALILKKVPITK